MEKKTHWKKLINPDYIGAYSLDEGKDLKVKITKVIREIVTGVGGKKDECTVAYLENQKPFILNSTNSKSIQKLFDTPYIENWEGKEIILYATKTKMAGEMVECLRIRPIEYTLPKEPESFTNEDIEALKKILDLANTKAELKSAYNSMQPKAKKAVFDYCVEVGNKLK